MKKDHKDFLLEINVEELPAAYVTPALAELKELFLKRFAEFRIKHGETDLFGTKNLLICRVKDVSVKQEESSSEIMGPPKRIAFDDKGGLTKQALGFAERQRVKPEGLKIKNTAKGEYVYVEKKDKSRNTGDVLKEIVPRVIKDIHFPKTMRWDSSGSRFARPVESLLAMFGERPLNIKIGNIPRKKIKPVSPEKYLARLHEKYLIDHKKRKSIITRLILGGLEKLNADADIDENLLEEINFMVTEPRVFTGEFNKKFLDLPEDVLKASMSKYQRLFPVLKKGRVTNKFIAVMDGKGRDIFKVRKNYEKILEARLRDSLFFFREDTKKSLYESRVQLKNLIFQKDLGNMFEKIERLRELGSFICAKLDIDGPLTEDIRRAAELSKADLTGHMVGEFPSLQGIMGREYALKNGENARVADAVREHYLPQGMDNALPESLAGSVLAIADRIDNVVGFLGMGAEPNSSFDPFGIRRNTQGFIQIVRNKSFRFDIDEVILKAIELYAEKLKVPRESLKDRIFDYVKERIEFLSGEIRPLELKEAVLAVRCFDIVDIFERLKDLSLISGEKYFLEAAKVVERTSNILKGAKGAKIGNVDENLFKEPLEREVWTKYSDIRERLTGLISGKKYKEATREYAGAFYKVLNEFFDNVLVNVEEDSLKSNRLGLMKLIRDLYAGRIADLAKLPQIVVK
jgi:glycyl-tRNA synthetase beta chain